MLLADSSYAFCASCPQFFKLLMILCVNGFLTTRATTTHYLPVRFAVGILLCVLFLGKVTLAIRDDSPHVVDVILVVLFRVLSGILF